LTGRKKKKKKKRNVSSGIGYSNEVNTDEIICRWGDYYF